MSECLDRLTVCSKRTKTPEPNGKFLINTEKRDEQHNGYLRTLSPQYVQLKPEPSLFDGIYIKNMCRKKLSKLLDRSETFRLDDRKEHVSIVTSSFDLVCKLEREFGGKQKSCGTRSAEQYRWDIFGAQAVYVLTNLTLKKRREDVQRFIARVEAKRSDPKFRLAHFGNLSYEHFGPLQCVQPRAAAPSTPSPPRRRRSPSPDTKRRARTPDPGRPGHFDQPRHLNRMDPHYDIARSPISNACHLK